MSGGKKMGIEEKTAAVCENMTYCIIQYHQTCCQHSLAPAGVTVLSPFIFPTLPICPFLLIYLIFQNFFSHAKTSLMGLFLSKLSDFCQCTPGITTA